MSQNDEIRILLGLAANLPGNVTDDDINQISSSAWLNKLKHLRLIIPAMDLFKKRGKLPQLPTEASEKLSAELRIAEIRSFLQWHDLIEITSAMKDAGIPCILIKGVSAQWRLYEFPAMRAGKDIDLLVPKNSIPGAKKAMQQLGFRQSAIMPDGSFVDAPKAQIAEVESKHYELAFYARRTRLDNLSEDDIELLRGLPGYVYDSKGFYYYSVVDIHWNLAFQFDDAELFQTCITEVINGVPFLVLKPELEIIYAAFKMYFESFDHYGGGVHFYGDITRLLSRYANEIDWKYFGKMVQSLKMEACCYFVFSHIKKSLPELLLLLMRQWEIPPDDILPHACMDFGDFIGFAMGLRIPVNQ